MKSLLEDWPYALIQTGVFVFFVFLCRSAWDHQGRRQRHRLLSTLVWGAVFGFIIEALVVGGQNPSYTYATDKFLSVLNVPIWVGLGWGMVAYGSIWTSDHLTFGLVRRASARSARSVPGTSAPLTANGPRWLLYVLRPICAGFFAVSIDILLDPVAHLMGFWTWKCDCELLAQGPCPVPCPPDPPGQHHMLRFYDVPFDNFVGWFAITLTYAASSYAVAAGSLALRRWARRKARLSGTKEKPFGARVALALTEPWVTFLIVLPVVAGLFVAFYQFVFRNLASWFYAGSTDDKEMCLFLFLFAVAGFVAASHAVQTPRTGPIKKGVLFIPIFFQGMPLLFLVTRGFERQPNLLASAPSYLLMGFLLFWWPFLDTVIDYLAGVIRSLTGWSRLVLGLTVAALLGLLLLFHPHTPAISVPRALQALLP